MLLKAPKRESKSAFFVVFNLQKVDFILILLNTARFAIGPKNKNKSVPYEALEQTMSARRSMLLQSS